MVYSRSLLKTLQWQTRFEFIPAKVVQALTPPLPQKVRLFILWWKRSWHDHLVKYDLAAPDTQLHTKSLTKFTHYAVRFQSNIRNQQLTWMYLSALLSTLRLEVFFSSMLGMFFFSVSKHSFKCARLTDTRNREEVWDSRKSGATFGFILDYTTNCSVVSSTYKSSSLALKCNCDR